MTELKLIACPHCPKSIVAAILCDATNRWQVFCGSCGSSSGSCKTEQQAAELWNTRTIPQITPEMVERAYKVYHGFIDTGIDFTGWTLQHLINFEKKRLRAAMVSAFNSNKPQVNKVME